MRVLVTGATGLLGARLVPILRDLDFEVVTHGRRPGADEAADLVIAEESKALLNRVMPDAIVHLVGLTDVDECERDPHRAYQLNVLALAHIVDWLRETKTGELVFVSTDQVYDAAGENAETDVLLRNTYGLTKLCGERVALEADAVVLRTNFFGRSHTPDRASFSDWVRAGSASPEGMLLLTDVEFSPLSIETLSGLIGTVLRSPARGVFNVGSRGGMSKRDFAYGVARELGVSLEGARDGTRADLQLFAPRPSGMIMDSGLFERSFGVAMPTLEQEIATAELLP